MRYRWIDIVRGICIICVVLSHSPYEPYIYRCIFEPFFLTTFFFLSGIVFTPKSIGKSLYSCSTKILWPYFVNSIIIILANTELIGQIIQLDLSGATEYFQLSAYRVITGKIFWFLACLYIVQVLAILIIRLFKGKREYIVGTAGACLSSIFAISGQELSIWNSNTAIFALGYFLLGYTCREKLLSSTLMGKKRFLGIIAIVLYITMIICINGIQSQALSFDMHNNELSPELLYLFLSLIGIATICIAGMSIDKCRLLEIIGANSLVIYMYHGYGISIAKHMFRLFNIDILSSFQYGYSILFCITATLISLIFALIINRFCPILTGRGNTINKIYLRLFKS